MIRGQQRRLWRRDDGHEELATTMEASAEKDEPEDSTITTEASAEETEETTCLSERLQCRRRRRVYSPKELTMTMVAFTEEYQTED